MRTTGRARSRPTLPPPPPPPPPPPRCVACLVALLLPTLLRALLRGLLPSSSGPIALTPSCCSPPSPSPAVQQRRAQAPDGLLLLWQRRLLEQRACLHQRPHLLQQRARHAPGPPLGLGRWVAARPGLPLLPCCASPACLIITRTRSPQLQRGDAPHALLRPLAHAGGRSCAYKDASGRPLQIADAPASPGPSAPVSWAAAPRCPTVPTPATSTLDASGRLWGYASKASCAYKSATGEPIYYAGFSRAPPTSSSGTE
jgi:hypothetical protein